MRRPVIVATTAGAALAAGLIAGPALATDFHRWYPGPTRPTEPAARAA